MLMKLSPEKPQIEKKNHKFHARETVGFGIHRSEFYVKVSLLELSFFSLDYFVLNGQWLSYLMFLVSEYNFENRETSKNKRLQIL